MFRFFLNPKYSKKEKQLLLDLFLSYLSEIYDEAECKTLNKDCRHCAYKNLCKDITQSVQHLSHI